MASSAVPVVVLTLGLRLAAGLASDAVTADLRLYQKVGRAVLEGEWNPYELPGLYPYPPLWVWIEAAAEWLARRLPTIGFATLVKVPSVLAEAGIVWLLWRWRDGQGRLAALLYALHPVSILVTGFHGQFDALPLFFVLLALHAFEEERYDRSALSLAAGILWKSFPVLLLPMFLMRLGDARRALRFAFLSTAPVLLALLPFVLDSLDAVRRELLGYSGIADFGWIGAVRGWKWLVTGILERSEPTYWGVLPQAGEAMFLCAYGVLLVLWRRGRLRLSLSAACLAVFVAFLALYGSLSAQYLLWVVPLGLLEWPRFKGPVILHAVFATIALVAFYLFFHPLVLLGAGPAVAFDRQPAGVVWVWGSTAVWALSLWWLAAMAWSGMRRGAQG